MESPKPTISLFCLPTPPSSQPAKEKISKVFDHFPARRWIPKYQVVQQFRRTCLFTCNTIFNRKRLDIFDHSHTKNFELFIDLDYWDCDNVKEYRFPTVNSLSIPTVQHLRDVLAHVLYNLDQHPKF